MTHLVNNLLDFGSLEREGKRRLFERTNIAQLISKEIEALRYQVQKEGFQLSADIDTGVPDTMADPTAITMAFFNLLDNSVKYSEQDRQIRVKVSQTNGYVDLSVADKGVGIPPGEQQKVFEKFYRGANALTRKVRGSGIGLSIIKHVAGLHGGKILLESEPGKGSTFTLRLPIVAPPDQAASAANERRPA
jgi:two-component system phosphate regulon sensor histidine kinase PhoR